MQSRVQSFAFALSIYTRVNTGKFQDNMSFFIDRNNVNTKFNLSQYFDSCWGFRRLRHALPYSNSVGKSYNSGAARISVRGGEHFRGSARLGGPGAEPTGCQRIWENFQKVKKIENNALF